MNEKSEIRVTVKIIVFDTIFDSDLPYPIYFNSILRVLLIIISIDGSFPKPKNDSKPILI